MQGTVFNIDKKLSAIRNPMLQIGDVKLEINSNATDMYRIMEMIKDGFDSFDAEKMQTITEIVFPKDSIEKLDKLGLTYADRMKVLTCAIQIISKGDLDAGEKDSGELEENPDTTL